MTTYRYTGYWFERDNAGAVTAWGVAQCDFVMQDADVTLRYDPGANGAPGTWVPQPLNIRVDGDRISDGTSNTLFAAEVPLGDGSVRFISGGLRVDGMANGRSYVFGMGDTLPVLSTRDDADGFMQVVFGDGSVRSLTGSVQEGVPFSLTDGTSNTVFIGESDVLDGSNQPERWNAGAGDDLVRGGGGADRLSGAQGDDTLTGDRGNDTLAGGSGADLLGGGAGHDRLTGGGGNDRLFGGAGDDDLFGGTGRDILSGGSGNDILDGGAGDDGITGGSGADAFLFAPGTGRDRITDFRTGEGDVLQLAVALIAGPLTGTAVLADYGRQTIEGVLLDFGGDTSVLLEGVEIDSPSQQSALAASIEFF